MTYGGMTKENHACPYCGKKSWIDVQNFGAKQFQCKYCGEYFVVDVFMEEAKRVEIYALSVFKNRDIGE